MLLGLSIFGLEFKFFNEFDDMVYNLYILEEQSDKNK